MSDSPSLRPITKVLVANRGEIALRIMRTLRSMGVRSVAVYSDVDASMPFARYADEAVHIGPATASESYLVFDRILEAAKSTGADAIHPGYGFLSENADFAEAVEAAGIAFIGPKPDSIRTMGDKLSAKEAVARQNVPLVPGSDGEVTNLDEAERLAAAQRRAQARRVRDRAVPVPAPGDRRARVLRRRHICLVRHKLSARQTKPSRH